MSYRHKSKTTRHLLVICLLDDALAIRHEAQDGLRMDITLRKVRAYPITEEQTQKDVLARIGWFDVAVEIEVDASGSALGATKVLVNPDSDVKAWRDGKAQKKCQHHGLHQTQLLGLSLNKPSGTSLPSGILRPASKLKPCSVKARTLSL